MSVVGQLVGSSVLQSQTLADALVPEQSKMSIDGKDFTYNPEKHVKSGADGNVYFASSSTGDQVCIKTGKGDGGKAALRNENELLAVFAGNAKIVQGLGFEDGEDPRLAIEKFDGALNGDAGVSTAPLPTRLQWISDIQTGLDDMHAVKITHGDVNTKNCLHGGGRAVIADLGGAKDFRTTDVVQGEIDPNIALAYEGDPEMLEFAISQARVTLPQAVESDRLQFVQLTFNTVFGLSEDKEMPSEDDRNALIQTLPAHARGTAREIFTKDPNTVATRYAQIPQLLEQLRPIPITAEQLSGLV